MRQSGRRFRSVLPEIHDVALRQLCEGLVALGALEGDPEELMQAVVLSDTTMKNPCDLTLIRTSLCGLWGTTGEAEHSRFFP